MGQQNVEPVRRAMEHWLRTGDALWAELDPDFEVVDHDIPDAGTYRGQDGFRQWMADFGAAWESFTVEPQEYIDAGDGKVVVLLRLLARGRGSGVSLERLDGIVWTVRDGKSRRLDYYNNPRAALQAVGLREQR
jgi:uncharacterized protein